MKKTMTAVLAMMLIMAMTVDGTYAYLTSTDSVTNTFTVGKVAITLDEAKTDAYGVADTTVARVKANEYKLIPGREYGKDPTVHVAVGSEECYVFVKIENGIEAIEDTTEPIADQIETNGWTLLPGETGVYYRVQAAIPENGTVANLPVFENFTIKADADVSTYGDAELIITAYAIQKDGILNAAAAWAALNPTPATPAQP